MRVVVTRPEGSARRTSDRLKALGHQPVLMPLTKALHHREEAEKALGKRHAALAVTSAEAVRVLSSLGDRLDPYLDETLFAVGAATARAAGETGFRDVRHGPGSGAGLVEIVASLAPRFSAPLLYLAGRPRSAAFEEGLSRIGFSFLTAEVYEMLPLIYEESDIHRLLLDPPAEAVLLYSRENAQLFFHQAARCAPVPGDVRILCLSENVARAVPREFQGNIEIAAHPDEEGLFALL